MTDPVANGWFLPLGHQLRGSTLEEDVYMSELSNPGLLINFLSQAWKVKNRFIELDTKSNLSLIIINC